MQEQYISIKTVIHYTGLKRTSIYKQMNLGKFPRSVSFGANRVAWKENEIQAWIKQKIVMRNQSSQIHQSYR
ncbi:AlpA family phage regulatory protein [Pseudoalteromonas sp. L1]|uniref:helix-turn-helix transcriptional regulator n=1 Tax=Pseudoalteromonas sp. L1 TaxID=195716 RepID=UPI001F37A798|nr:AlpA family phage regulatory protein [Pseudoalteromonas sp. L1]